MTECESDKFTPADGSNSRGLCYYGKYEYRYGNKKHEPAPFPNAIQEIIAELQKTFPQSPAPNSCLISRYEDGSQYVPPHADDEPFIGTSSDIFTLSLGATRDMQFTNCHDKSMPQTVLTLEDNSLVMFSRYSQTDWHHGIAPTTTAVEPRYSLTFRYLAPYNIHSTAIFGDSNTADLKFGTGFRTFGKWLPGKRVKAARIGNLPTPDKVGPYRNVVFSTGINDLNNTNGKPMSELVQLYESKCRDLITIYPKVKVYISLILPTKDAFLNKLANEFNVYLTNMANKYNNISVIRHDCLVNTYGFLDEYFGRYEINGHPCSDIKKGYPSNDTVHLGPEGYRLLMSNIKDSVITKRRKQDTKRVPYHNPDRSSTRQPEPRSQPDLCPTPFPNLHSSRSGYAPFPTHPGPQPPAPLPTPGSFNGDYHAAALGKTNYALPYPGSDDRHHY
jgi:alkylated DNA repair dioxygenase AlkB